MFVERKKALKNLVQGPGARKSLSVIESYTRVQFSVMSRTVTMSVTQTFYNNYTIQKVYKFKFNISNDTHKCQNNNNLVLYNG